MSSLYAWQVLEPDTGEWNIISAFMPSMGHVPLVSTRMTVANLMEPFAADHAEYSGKSVRLVRYEDPEILRTRSP